MKHDIINIRIKEALSLYALNALGEYEAKAIEKHLADGCVVCSEELRLLVSVTQHLGWVTEERNPPPSLRKKLMGRVAEEEELIAPFLRRPNLMMQKR